MVAGTMLVGCNVHKERRIGQDANKLQPQDRPVHDWYRFVLSFPPHLVRDYLASFEVGGGQVVLDPFCGTGTTLVEAKKSGISSVGLEANPMAHFAASTKIDWSPDPDALLEHAKSIADSAIEQLAQQGITDGTDNDVGALNHALLSLPSEQAKLILKDSISPLPLHKALVLLDCLNRHRDDRFRAHELLAFAKTVVHSASNLHFGPEVGVSKHLKQDASVIRPWYQEIENIAADLRAMRALPGADAHVHLADAREIADVLPPKSVDVVITSPPYPNEKDYTRTTRLESVLLGFLNNRKELQMLKRSLLRSNTRTVYQGDDDDKWVASHPEVQRLAAEIEARRLELGKTSGFERLYGKVVTQYFGGMARHFERLKRVLRPGARLAYVVGDQASFFRVMIRTGTILADIAQRQGYEVERIDLFRTRRATATGQDLREEVVVLRWPGV